MGCDFIHFVTLIIGTPQNRLFRAIVSVDVDKIEAIEEIRRELSVTLAKAGCMHISKEEIHELVDEIYNKHLSDVQN